MFRFTIRDLLWLTVVVALGVGWWVREGRFRDEREAAEKHANLWMERADTVVKQLSEHGTETRFFDGGVHFHHGPPYVPKN